MLRLLVLLVVAGVRGEVPSDEPSYSLPEGITLEDGDTFEYIVVGAGAAGAPVAARLALAGADVLLVEAGETQRLFHGYLHLFKVPMAAMALLGSPIDYHYETISNNVSCLSANGKSCQASRGKCLGGSTSINYMMYVRGNRDDFDSLNISGWAWDDMEPYFLRYEGLQDLDLLPESSIPYHNTTGTMKVGFFEKYDNPWHSRVIDGYEALNFPYDHDINAISQIGVSQVIGYTYNKLRMSTARGYLGRDDVKSKLNVAKNTKCTGVIIDEDNVARGVTVVTGLFKRKLRLYASREVVLSAGALSTPQLLMLSGIGHAEHLKQFDIPVRADLSVGDNMTDHTLALVFVKVDKKSMLGGLLDNTGKIFTSLEDIILSGGGPLGSIGLTDVTVFVNTQCYDFEKHQLTNSSSDCELPTTQLIHAFLDRDSITDGAPLPQALGWNNNVIKQLVDINKNYDVVLTSSLVLQTKSQGNVRLASTDPLKDPAIFPNYLADSRDVEEIVRGIRIIQDLSKTSVFSEKGASIVTLDLEGCPDSSEDSDEYWSCYARHMTFSTFHSVGTTALERVVDGRLRVHGISRLRVADAGVMTKLPRGNTAASCIAIGERVADFILEDNAE